MDINKIKDYKQQIMLCNAQIAELEAKKNKLIGELCKEYEFQAPIQVGS